MYRAVKDKIVGRVQRVGYHHWTDHQAREMGLYVWVCNLRDGTVEALYSSNAEQVKILLSRVLKALSCQRLLISKPIPSLLKRR